MLKWKVKGGCPWIKKNAKCPHAWPGKELPGKSGKTAARLG
ncbi:Protein of unknown function [Lactobacillus equicursoris DSM 19284 = JCM 14600 = CIP 110162]|nr:Protein of unknown function [Lactobacillus equicursoris DSM 19284 = JCM 14600 = CIP 110162]